MNKQDIIHVYRKRAKAYDIEARLFRLIGFRLNGYRIGAVNSLCLEPGDTVVDLCCGTGLNFLLLQRKVGESGRIIGVDQSADMLEQARLKIEEQDWKNVELVESDAALYSFPKNVNGIITTYAITLIPEYDEIIANGALSLSSCGRFVVLDFRMPGWPLWLVRLALNLLVKPFGGTLEMAGRHPWESIERHLAVTAYREYFFGSTFYIAGQKRIDYSDTETQRHRGIILDSFISCNYSAT